MKIHISRIYGLPESEPLVITQKALASAGHSLGYYELSLYRYPVSSDSDSELSKRIDGIISGIESGDFVFLQLPTGNGFIYDYQLFAKLKAYGAKVALIFSDLPDYCDSISSFNNAECAIFSTISAFEILQAQGLSIYSMVKNISSNSNEMYLKKILLDTSCAYNEDATNAPVDLIHVCFAVHDRTGDYCSNIATTMQSIINNTESIVCFHILIDDSVSNRSISMLKSETFGNGHFVKFHLVDKARLNSDNSWLKLYTVGSFPSSYS